MWTGKLIVLGVSILFFVATEFLYPTGSDPNASKQKHFWAVIFMVFSLILGFPIENSFEMQAKIDELKKVLKEHSERQITVGKFQDLLVKYDENFGQATPAMREWADETIGFISESWSQGVMPLPKEFAAEKIGKVYYEAKKSIVATNVGSTKFYFDVHTYAEANRFARNQGIPVVRFYIYRDKYKNYIVLRNGKHPSDINDFFAEVKDLHNLLGSAYSAVIDVDRLSLEEHRDLLIMDNKFVAETKLSPDWEPIRALGTENQEQLKKVRSYFHVLMGALDEKYIERMNANDVRKYFGSASLSSSGGKEPAQSLFEHLMRDVTGQ